jgi:hypothetical protein
VAVQLASVSREEIPRGTQSTPSERPLVRFEVDLVAAEIALVAGDADAARSQAQRVLDLATRLQMPTFQLEARLLLGRAGGGGPQAHAARLAVENEARALGLLRLAESARRQAATP